MTGKARTPQATGDEIPHFSLQGLLPPDQALAFNPILGTLSLLASVNGSPRVLVEEQFTTSEICLLIPLLEAYPYYCPHEVLLASFSGGRLSEKNIARCRERLQEAREVGVWDQEMRPIRNVISRVRIKFRVFDIEISSILETGYILMYRFNRPSTTSV